VYGVYRTVYGGTVYHGVRRDSTAVGSTVYGRCTVGVCSLGTTVYGRCTVGVRRASAVGVRQVCTVGVRQCTAGGTVVGARSGCLLINTCWFRRLVSGWPCLARIDSPWPKGPGYHLFFCQPRAPPPQAQTVWSLGRDHTCSARLVR